jgi:glycosyltransferase involved in cell wall biosynthesis
VSAPITFLMYDVSGRGGVARSVVNLANRLADHRDVRVVSLHRRSARSTYELDPRVSLEVLVDEAALSPLDRVWRRRPTALRPVPAEKHMTRLTDRVLRRRLTSLEPGVLISTRPSLHLAAVRWAAPGVRLVGQDHKNFSTRFSGPRQPDVLREAVPRLDAYVVLTHADAEDYRHELPGLTTRVEVIRNALPWAPAETPAPLASKVVVAAGRLAREKGFERMLEAFAPVARDHPDWQLHIYGEGTQRGVLTDKVRRLGLDDQVRLPGYADDFRGVLGGAAAYAMTSRAEGFPMVLIEALSVGLPLVAMDCPRGPGEIVRDGKNGFLVDDCDIAGFGDALRALVEDDELRRDYGRQALEDSHRYTADAVLADWLTLLDDL